MIDKTASFHRSTPIERNDGTHQNTARSAERKSVKAIASAVLQRNASRNDGGTTENDTTESFHRSTVWEWNDGTVCGPYMPYCPPISIELVDDLHRLIAEYAKQYRLSETETTNIIESAKRQALASVQESVRWFEKELKAPQ